MTSPAPTSHRASLAFLLVVSLVVLSFCWQVIRPFSTPILLAAVVVAFTSRLYERLVRKLKGRRQAAAWIMCALVTLVIVVPLLLLVLLLVQEAASVLSQLTPQRVLPILNELRIDHLQQWLQSLAPRVDFSQLNLEATILQAVQTVPSYLVGLSGSIIGGTVDLLLGFFLMLVTTAYLYVDGPHLVRQALSLSPLPDRYDRELIETFRTVVHSALRGSFLSGLAQGVVVAIGFAIAGIHGAVFWGAVAVVLSFLPMVGSALVWLPGVLLLGSGVALHQPGFELWQPIFLLAWGVVIVSTVDIIVRPLVMTDDAHLPTIVLFFSILGGLVAFGVTGLLLGPLLFALLATLMRIYLHLFGKDAPTHEDTPRSATARRAEGT